VAAEEKSRLASTTTLGVGIRYDYCKYGLFDIDHNRIIHNGANGIQWELSGGSTADDRAIVRNNVIRR
jgi:hypothetical protein